MENSLGKKHFGAIDWFGFGLLGQMIELCTGNLFGEAGLKEKAESGFGGGSRRAGDVTGCV